MTNRHDTVKETVQDLLAHMGMEIDEIEELDEGIGIQRFNVRSKRDAKALIGTHGETLQALNLVVKKILEPQDGDANEDEEILNFIVDVDDYQRERLIELKNMTKIIAERVKLFRHDLPLPSMSSYERMIVHSVSKTIPGILSESRGIGRGRYVVIRVSGVTDTAETFS